MGFESGPERHWQKQVFPVVRREADGAISACTFSRSAGAKTGTTEALCSVLKSWKERGPVPRNRVFYLAMPPSGFAPSIEGLGVVGLNQSSGWTRLVIEKPFGRDLASAQDLNRLVHEYFEESQIYRIDHYLGKETVQNLLVFRFANPLFESVWNRDRVESVEITVAEQLGVGERAGYYDKTGALRDMVPESFEHSF